MTDTDQANLEGEGKEGTGHPAPARVPAAGMSEKKSGTPSSARPLILDEAVEDFLPPHQPRDKFLTDNLFVYGTQAALVACLFGFAWAAGVYFANGRSPIDIFRTEPVQTAASSENLQRNEMLLTAQKTADDVRAIKAEVDALRASQSQMARQATALEGLKKGLDSVRNETGASIAELSSKVERLQHEPQAKLSQIIDRLDHLDKVIASAPATATSNAAAAPANAGKQLHVAAAKPVAAEPVIGEKRPQLITNWVVRDVYGGVALVESPHGSIEVMPGETIPGAGVVKSIERRGGGWIIITSRGLVASAHEMYEP
ncbi:MAG: hypothetical protein FWD08_07195 [Alphaproteobacteria bacterium]|nr:hypothetical protein [Alphaproteobacteria bacterium]MCL2453414.1 hypothetical protein [Alphaproteobacteria bacterium]